MKFLIGLASMVSADSPLMTIPIELKNGRYVTTQDVAVIDGQSVGPMLIDFNYPDIVVPVCTNKDWAIQDRQDPQSLCYNPKTSDAFRYCDSGTEQCFDLMSPKLSCMRSVPASKWSLETSTLTEHTFEIEGRVTSIHAFEFSSTLGGAKVHVPMKGSISLKTGVLGLAPPRISCRNETMLTKIGSKYVEFGKDSIVLFRDSVESSKGSWTVPYHLLPVNSSSVRGKFAFNMFSPRVCGVDVLGWNISSHWTSIIDVSRECLILPDFVVDNLHAWEGGDGHLMFKVDQNSEQLVTIPLGKVCIQEFRIMDGNFESTGNNPIVFGASVIRALTESGSIGFESITPYRIRLPTTNIQSISCPVPRPTCVGEQTYYEARNVCLDPLCEAYMLAEMDEETRVCEWRAVVPYVAYTLILAYLIMELFTFRLRGRAVEISRLACERSTGQVST
jgi:hypothetical protein